MNSAYQKPAPGLVSLITETVPVSVGKAPYPSHRAWSVGFLKKVKHLKQATTCGCLVLLRYSPQQHTVVCNESAWGRIKGTVASEATGSGPYSVAVPTQASDEDSAFNLEFPHATMVPELDATAPFPALCLSIFNQIAQVRDLTYPSLRGTNGTICFASDLELLESLQ